MTFRVQYWFIKFIICSVENIMESNNQLIRAQSFKSARETYNNIFKIFLLGYLI